MEDLKFLDHKYIASIYNQIELNLHTYNISLIIDISQPLLVNQIKNNLFIVGCAIQNLNISKHETT